jgi:Tfp pilus assembly protein PilN
MAAAGDDLARGGVMLRPNLAARPFLDTRPVVVASVALALLAVALTAVSAVEFASERGAETQVAEAVRRLQARRDALTAEVTALDRQLGRAPWKKLKAEAASMQQIVVRRRSIWGPLFADLERVLPWDARLTSIDPQIGEDGAISVGLSGIATGRPAWLKLLGRLFTDSHFSDPLPLSEEAPGQQNNVGFRFTLRVRYWPDGRQP